MSALVHSATLVVAGLVVLIKMGIIFHWLFLLLGVVSLWQRALGAAVEEDVKKIVAFSTAIHLSLILLILVGVRLVEFGVVHMGLHGVFKASLFVLVG